jgi:hypothetical protein
MTLKTVLPAAAACFALGLGSAAVAQTTVGAGVTGSGGAVAGRTVLRVILAIPDFGDREDRHRPSAG